MTTLHELIPAWPERAPASAAELVFVENEELDELGLDADQRALVMGLRTQVRRAITQRGNSNPLSGAEAVARALDTNDLRLVGKRWLTLVLDRNRRRVFAQHNGEVRTVSHLSHLVPSVEDLPPLPPGGVYLLLYGGGPEVLDIDDARRRLVDLLSAAPVADVVFRRLERSRPPALFSTREGCGEQNRERVEFPNPDHLKEVALW